MTTIMITKITKNLIQSSIVILAAVSLSNSFAKSIAFAPTGNSPTGIFIDSSNNVYTANDGDNTVSKITPNGASSILGRTENRPSEMVIDAEGNFYVTNFASNNVSKITPSGQSSVFANTGTGPIGIAIDRMGNIYTANLNSNNVSKITPDGQSSILGSTGDGPRGIVIDDSGNVFTANSGGNNVTKITPAGRSSILGTTGQRPWFIIIDKGGNIYTSNFNSNDVSKITPDGQSSILAPVGTGPRGIAIDDSGNIYTANFASDNVSQITSGGVSSIFGTTESRPFGLALDLAGNVYISNRASNSVTKIFASGFTQSTNALSINDNNRTGTYTIVLNRQPTADVVINLSSSDTSKVKVSPSSLTFTVANWDVQQTITVTSANNVITNGSVMIAASIDSSSAAEYRSLADQIVTVTLTGNGLSAPVVNSPANNSVLTERMPIFIGTGVPGAALTVTDNAGHSCVVTVAADNSWRCQISPALGLGNVVFDVSQRNATGTVSPITKVALTIEKSSVITPPTTTATAIPTTSIWGLTFLLSLMAALASYAMSIRSGKSNL